MKPQQRSFVVEYKSGRRSLTKRPNSIWGNTNFKELVRQAEAETPQLFKQEEAAEDQGANIDKRVDPVCPAPSADVHVDTADLQISAHSADQSEDLGETSPEVIDASPPMVKASRKRRRTKIARYRVNAVKRQGDRPMSESSAEELAQLEGENRQLKVLLAEHLHEQNAKLRGMLERFDLG